MKYKEMWEGEWHRITKHKFRMVCCDCGLTHNVDFRNIKGDKNSLEIRLFRNNRATMKDVLWTNKKEKEK